MRILLIVVSLFVFIGCKSKKRDSKDSFSVEFGSGGGITGETITYKIDSKGEMYRLVKLSNDSSRLKTITQEQYKYLRTLINTDTLLNINLDKYGNMTSFIEITNNNKPLKSFHWETGITVLPKPLGTLDSFLNTLIK